MGAARFGILEHSFFSWAQGLWTGLGHITKSTRLRKCFGKGGNLLEYR